jgi:hypothetical protein
MLECGWAYGGCVGLGSILLVKDRISGRCTGRFIMFSTITNIYNKKTKGPILMELFTATGKLKTFCFIARDVRCVHDG